MTPGLRYAVVLAFAASPAVAADVTYEVGVRSDVRARTPLPGDVAMQDGRRDPTGDLEFTPRGQLTLGIDASAFHALYAPTLTWREPQQGKSSRFLPVHRARLAFDSRWSRGVFLLAEDGTYGKLDVGAFRMAEGATDPVSEARTTGPLTYLRSFTSAGIESRPTDHFTLGVVAGYQVSGSDNPDQLPLQYGPTLLANARFAVSRLDGLTTSAQAAQAHFETGADQLVAQLREVWDRQLTRTVTFNVGAGVALARQVIVPSTLLTGITPGTFVDLLPLANVGVDWREVLSDHPIRLDASLRMSPFADRFTGAVYERVELRGHGEWRFAKDWLATAAVGGAVAVPTSLTLSAPEGPRITQAGDRVVYGEGTVAWTLKTWLILQASARVLWTQQPRSPPSRDNPAVQAVGTVSVMVQQQDSLAW